MKGFVCVNCKRGSLVKSNFRFTPSGVCYCKRPECTEVYNNVNRRTIKKGWR